jgi:formate dehydrogenase maturation protein FdhE
MAGGALFLIIFVFAIIALVIVWVQINNEKKMKKRAETQECPFCGAKGQWTVLTKRRLINEWSYKQCVNCTYYL